MRIAIVGAGPAGCHLAHLCWLLNSSTRVSCAEIAEIRYHAVQSTIHLGSITA
jgi:flavin-dependent dehydrogenase